MSKEVQEKAAHTFVNVTIRNRAIFRMCCLWLQQLSVYTAAPLSLGDLCPSTVTAYCLCCSCVQPVMYCIGGHNENK